MQGLAVPSRRSALQPSQRQSFPLSLSFPRQHHRRSRYQSQPHRLQNSIRGQPPQHPLCQSNSFPNPGIGVRDLADSALCGSFDQVMSEPTRLKRVGLLRRGEESNIDAVAAARTKFKQIYGVAVEDRVHRNDTEANLLNSTRREDVSAYIQSYYQNVRSAQNDFTDYARNRTVIDDPEMVNLESLDLFVNPHMQQGRIDNEYLIERQIDENVRRGRIDAVVGDARFWKAIDDSFDAKEVEKVQRQLGDAEPNNFAMRSHSSTEVRLDANGKVVDLEPRH